MEFDNSFDVPLPPAEAWKVLLDVQRMAPCLPGAELTEVVDEATCKGKVSVKLGPVALTFAGQVRFEDIDNVSHKARVKAQGTDAKGRGGANAVVDFHLEPTGAGSTVFVHTNLTLSGAVAQYGRGVGMIKDMASQLIGQFSDNLKRHLQESSVSQPVAETSAPVPAAAAPISGFSMIFSAFWRSLRRLFGGNP